MMDPFDKHLADPTVLAEWERHFVVLAQEVVDIEALTDAAFDPAVASWEGIALAELQAAPEPVRNQAYEVASHLTWGATATNVWARHVRRFNRKVDGLRYERDQVPVDVERYLADRGWLSFPVFDQEAIRERRRGELIQDLNKRWGDAYEEHIEQGSREVAGMYRRGPTWENLELAHRTGALSANSALLHFFAAGWEAGAAPAEALWLAERFTDPNYRPTNEEIARFHDLLERYADDEAFWYHFLTGLGPGGLLLLNGSAATLVPDLETSPFWDERLAERIGEIQALLGGGLALATKQRGTDTPAEYELGSDWLVELTVAGQQLYEIGGPGTAFPDGFEVRGYQLLGPLLSNGDYDARFLGMVGGDLVDFEMAQGGSGSWPVPDLPSLVPGSSDLGNPLRLDWTRSCWGLSSPAGFDPLGGLTAAMERNPEGALELLHGRRETGAGSWADGTPKGEGFGHWPPPPDGYRLPRLDYLLTDREWPPDWVRTTQNAIIGAGMGGQGNGNESTALPRFGDVLVEVSRLDGDRAVDVVELIVYEVNTDEQAMGYANGEVPGDGQTTPNIENDMIDPLLRPALGTIMADYIVDVNRAAHISDMPTGPGGRGADFYENQLVRFLADLGKDQTAYETVSAAQAVFTTNALHAYLTSEGGEFNPDGDARLFAAEIVTEQAGMVMGALDKGAEASLWYESWLADNATNAFAEEGFMAAGHLAGVAGEAVGDVVPGAGYVFSEGANAALDAFMESTTVDNRGQANYLIAEMIGGGRQSAADMMEAALYHSGNLPGLPGVLFKEDGSPIPMADWGYKQKEAWTTYRGYEDGDQVRSPNNLDSLPTMGRMSGQAAQAYLDGRDLADEYYAVPFGTEAAP